MAYVYLYVIFPAGKREVVYVGKTHGDYERLVARIKEHARDQEFNRVIGRRPFHIEYKELGTPCDADAMETLLIGRYQPELNTAKKGWGSPTLSVPEIHWLIYSPELSSHALILKKAAEARKAKNQKRKVCRCDLCGERFDLDGDIPPTLRVDLEDSFGCLLISRWCCPKCFEGVSMTIERITDRKDGGES